MNLKFKRKIFSFVGTFGLVFSFAMPVAFGAIDGCSDSTSAPQFSLLPFTSKEYADCKTLMNKVEVANENLLKESMKSCRNDILACGINTGRISFWMAPYFITYITNFLLGLSGLICVLFIVIGGYWYVIGGLIEKKEEGKNTIKHALMGMGISLLAWTVVNVLISAVTG